MSENISILLDSLTLRNDLSLYLAIAIFAVFTILGIYVAKKDAQEKIIPNWYNYSLFIIGMIANPLLFTGWISHYITMIVVLVLFFLLAILSRGGIGMGDVKLYTALSLFFGPSIIIVILFANIGALFVGIAINHFSTANDDNLMNTAVPMAPMIFLGVIFTILLNVI